jgi:hypothetical protein
VLLPAVARVSNAREMVVIEEVPLAKAPAPGDATRGVQGDGGSAHTPIERRGLKAELTTQMRLLDKQINRLQSEIDMLETGIQLRRVRQDIKSKLAGKY